MSGILGSGRGEVRGVRGGRVPCQKVDRVSPHSKSSVPTLITRHE